MRNIITLILLIFIIFFIYFTITKYLSDSNIKMINSNRFNIKENIADKITNLDILKNDTDNIIEFNSGFNVKDENKKKRNFWELFKKDE